MMEAQIESGLCRQGIEHRIAGKAKNVVDIIVFRPFHGLEPGVMAVATPDHARLPPMSAQSPGHMLDDGADLGAVGVQAGRRIAATGVPLAT